MTLLSQTATPAATVNNFRPRQLLTPVNAPYLAKPAATQTNLKVKTFNVWAATSNPWVLNNILGISRNPSVTFCKSSKRIF